MSHEILLVDFDVDLDNSLNSKLHHRWVIQFTIGNELWNLFMININEQTSSWKLSLCGTFVNIWRIFDGGSKTK